MQMSDELKNMLTSHVYEGVRSREMVAQPAMKTWDELTGDEQMQCREAMRLWLDGLGSNEVAEAWFERSGQFPRAMWGQLPGGPDRNVFCMATLDLLGWLIVQANQQAHPFVKDESRTEPTNLTQQEIGELLELLNVAFYDADALKRQSRDHDEVQAYREHQAKLRTWITRLTRQIGSEATSG